MPSIKTNKFLDLSKVFKKLEDKSYCIIKLPDIFPSYEIGSDLDIFCYDIQDISKIILSSIQEFITPDLKIEITDNKTQIYIDVIHNSKIHIRFDLYGALPLYKNVNIKKAFFSSVIENSSSIRIDAFDVKVPSIMDESILRYIEYQEWYAQRPDKIKHIKYLEDKIKDNKIDTKMMFDKLHYYIAIPNVEENRQVSSSNSIRYIQYLFDNFKRVINYIKKYGIKDTLSKIKNRL